jgi:hypothetical protein
MPPKSSQLQRISYITPSHLARIIAGVTAILSFLFLLPGGIIELGTGMMHGEWRVRGFVLIGAPFVFTLFSYTLGLIVANAYNILAKYMGGIEIELSGDLPK